jgi:hypothetical protein
MKSSVVTVTSSPHQIRKSPPPSESSDITVFSARLICRFWDWHAKSSFQASCLLLVLWSQGGSIEFPRRFTPQIMK